MTKHCASAPLRADLITPSEAGALSRHEKIRLLQNLQHSGLRRSTLVLFCISEIFAGGSGGLTDTEYFALLHQAVVAALDCGEVKQADLFLEALSRRFGKQSTRVRKLFLLSLEAKGQWQAAREGYESILRDVPSDDFAVKRLAVLLKSQGNLNAAIDVLEKKGVYVDENGVACSFCDFYPLDLAALRELCLLHQEAGNLDRAIHYAEECLLCRPMEYTLHTRHGELRFAAGDFERAALCFSHSLWLNSAANNVRAAYGLWLVTEKLQKVSFGERSTKSRNTENNASHANLVDAKQTSLCANLKKHALSLLKKHYAESPLGSVLDLVLRNEA